MSAAKPFAISKRMVWEAYKAVKANGGAPGFDGQSLEDFGDDLGKNLYRIWNRMASGSYFPPPVLRVEIPKPDGGVRALGIPTSASYCTSYSLVSDCCRSFWIFVEPRTHSRSSFSFSGVRETQ